jgi:hypothetical protein
MGSGGGDMLVVQAPPDMTDNGMVSTVYPAPHPDPPQVQNGGGPVLTTPLITPVFFNNDDATMVTTLKDFYSKVGGTKYFGATTQEYGITGPATAAKAVDLAEAAPNAIDDNGIQTWLATKLNNDADMTLPKPTDNTLYVLNYPTTTTITLQNSQSCQTFGGYHNSVALDANHNSRNVAYAVVPRCNGFAGMNVQDTTTGSASHEIIEAVTDPYPMVNNAFGQVDQDHFYWGLLGGGEVGDLCAQNPGSFTRFSELPSYTVQRTWSNKSALASHDPCVPFQPANEVYFNSAPVLNDDIMLFGQLQSKGVQIPVGSKKTIELDLFSDGPTSGPWTVKVEDLGSKVQGGKAAFNFTLDRNSGQNGEKLHLTIESVSATQYNAGVFVIVNALGNQRSTWLGLIGQ